jgi:hypothetical protein
MADPKDSSLQFFQKATPCQWSYLLTHYKDVMKIHAQKTRGFKKNGPEELLKLDNWFQDSLPKIIHSRKDIHVTRDELIQITKWKLVRAKPRSRLLDLVRLNTDLAVKQATLKAFKKLPKDLASAVNALTNLKGVGPQTASAVLCAGFPDLCPFMADEAMLSTPGVEASDYTQTEFVNFATQIKSVTERLNNLDPEGKWNPHTVELALWVHYLSKDLKPSILSNLPLPDGSERPKADPDDDDDIADEEEEVTSSDLDHLENDSSRDVENGNATSTTGTNGNGRHATSSLDEDSNISAAVSAGGSDAASLDEKSNNSNSNLEDEADMIPNVMSSNSNDDDLPEEPQSNEITESVKLVDSTTTTNCQTTLSA